MVTTAVVGARGYLGRETIRLLHDHPDVSSVIPVSQNAAGTPYADHVPSMAFADLEVAATAGDAEIIFLATPGGVAKQIARDNPEATLIDLSRDHRPEAINGQTWHYGLADLQPAQPGMRRVANPGCYPTASLLGSKPLADAGLITGQVIVDGKSGASGAGQQPSAGLHFPAMQGSVHAYKVAGHDHEDEIAQALKAPVCFTPHLVPQSRGLLATLYIPTDASEETVLDTLRAAYVDSPFVFIRDEADTAAVAMSNHAHVAATTKKGMAIVRVAIDNLIKGGAGQAVQNMNGILGVPANRGLTQTGGGI